MKVLHSIETRQQATTLIFTPLAQEQRTHVDTATAAHHLLRRPQTLRGFHCHGAYPDDALRPLVVNGRLAWPVAGLKKVMLGVSK
jgi:hypothetical protein